MHVHLVGPEHIVLIRVNIAYNAHIVVAPGAAALITSIEAQPSNGAKGLQLGLQLVHQVWAEGDGALVQPAAGTLVLRIFGESCMMVDWSSARVARPLALAARACRRMKHINNDMFHISDSRALTMVNGGKHSQLPCEATIILLEHSNP